MDEAAHSESELLNLLSAVWDDHLDATSRARLEELLSQDDFAAVEFLTSLTRLHLDLEWLVSSKAVQEKALASLQEVRAAQQTKRLRHQYWRIAGVGSLAAAVLIWMTYAWYFAWRGHEYLVRPPQPLGEVASVDGAEWKGETAPNIGDAILEGETVEIQTGFARLSMGFGADLLLQGPCRAQILASNRVALERGQIAVRAAAWATGFQVDTPDLAATDLGTWFVVQTGGGPSEIHVLEGVVSARSRNDARTSDTAIRLLADQAAQMSRKGELQPIKFRTDTVADKLTQFEPLRPIQIWNTGVGVREGDADPHWKVTAGDNHGGPFPRPAIVAEPHGSYGVNQPDRSQWISVEGGTIDGVPARSRYTFETTFDLTGFDLSSIWVSGLILADDGVDEVWLNGNRLNIAPWKDWGYGVIYNRFHPIEIRSGFIPGINRLGIVVKNERFIYRSEKGFDLPETPNPMALRTEWQAFGRPIGGAGGA